MERKKEEEKKEERLNDGNNNGQAMHGARKHAWRTQAAWAKIYLSQIKCACQNKICLGTCVRNLWSPDSVYETDSDTILAKDFTNHQPVLAAR